MDWIAQETRVILIGKQKSGNGICRDRHKLVNLALSVFFELSSFLLKCTQRQELTKSTQKPPPYENVTKYRLFPLPKVNNIALLRRIYDRAVYLPIQRRVYPPLDLILRNL